RAAAAFLVPVGPGRPTIAGCYDSRAMIVSSRSMKRLLFVLLANCFVLVIFLYAFEWFHHAPFTGIKKEEHNKIYSWGVPITYNKEGFRERELTPKAKNGYRVMVVGDSFTFGVGITDAERYSNRLETMLRERYPNVPIDVLNFSSGGNNTAVEEKLVEQ